MNTADRRRVLGPSNAKLPKALPSIIQKETKPPTKNDDEIKKMFIKTGFINNANGSAYLEVENTIIEVSVFGPRPIRGSFVDQASFSVDCNFLPHLVQPNEEVFNENSNSNFNKNGKTGLTVIEQKIASYVENSLLPSILLTKYPKSTIDLHVSIIDNKSCNSSNSSLLNLINWIINCSSLALVDSGIEIMDIVTSGQIRYNLKNEAIIMDPLYDDLTVKDDEGSIDCLVSFMILKNDEIVGLWIEGEQSDISELLVEKLVDSCNGMAREIRSNINSYLINND